MDRQSKVALYERDAERVTIEQFVSHAGEGDGALLAVEGSPGIGKTALLRLAREAAKGLELDALYARGSELESDFPFGVVRQLFEPPLLSASGSARTELFTGPAALADPLLSGGWAPPADPESDPALPLLHGLYWFLANLSRDRPLLLVIDDLHWADDASLRFLLFLLPRLESLPVAIVVATRPEDGRSTSGSLARLLGDPLVEVLSPTPLSESGVGSMLRDALGEPDTAFVRACHRATGCNPFFLGELVRERDDRGTDPTADYAHEVDAIGPQRIAGLLRRRLERLPAAASALARAIAVLGDDAEVRHAARLGGLADVEAGEIAVLLVRAGVLGDERPLRFAHPIVRLALYAELNEPERAAAHGKAARLLAAERAIDAAAAHHLHSEPTADPHAVELLVRAAERATARGVPSAALRFLLRALDEPPPPDRRVEVLTALGRAELAIPAAAQAEEHLREALDLADDPRARADVAVELAHAIAMGRSVDEGCTLLEHEREDLAEADRELALKLEAEFAGVAWLNVANAPPATRIERYARLSGRTPVERKLLASVAHLWALTGRSAAECGPLARRALADGGILGEQGLGVAHWGAAFLVLSEAEDAEATDDALAAALAEARRHVAPFEFCQVSDFASRWAWLRGDLSSAEASITVALDVGREHGFRTRRAYRELPIVLERQGVTKAEEFVNESDLQGDLPDGLPFQGFRLARGVLRIAQGRTDEAIADLEEVAAFWAALGVRSVVPGPYRSMLAVALRERDRERARGLAEEELRLARDWGAPGAIGVALRGLALVEGGERGVRLLREAAATLSGSQRRLEHARTLVELGAALRREGQRREAREALREGADLAHRCGAAALEERARSELKATGARPRNILLTGVESLTPMERRIADLAAQGLKNAEIAQALFVTVKNVEMHLSRAYRKLDISSRTELPAALAEEESTAPVVSAGSWR